MGKDRWAQVVLRGEDSSFVLENDAELVPAIVDGLHRAAVARGLFDEETAVRVDIALHEAFLNAIHHGNLELDSRLRLNDDLSYYRLAERRRRLEPYRSRRLHVRVRFSPHQASYVIRDEGPGFEPASLPDPTDPSRTFQPSGRGLLLIRHYMDEVIHNVSGNEITLIKRQQVNPRGLAQESPRGARACRSERVGA